MSYIQLSQELAEIRGLIQKLLNNSKNINNFNLNEGDIEHLVLAVYNINKNKTEKVPYSNLLNQKHFKGFYGSLEELTSSITNPNTNDFAFINTENEINIALYFNESWRNIFDYVNNHISNTQIHITTAEKNKLRDLANTVLNNTLTSTSTTEGLTANQGRVLKGFIDTINQLLASDDVSLDELQEIVTYIKQNRNTLNALSIPNIAGLQEALDNLTTAIATAETNAKAHAENHAKLTVVDKDGIPRIILDGENKKIKVKGGLIATDYDKSISAENLVPYTGATKNVDLGNHNINAGLGSKVFEGSYMEGAGKFARYEFYAPYKTAGNYINSFLICKRIDLQTGVEYILPSALMIGTRARNMAINTILIGAAAGSNNRSEGVIAIGSRAAYEINDINSTYYANSIFLGTDCGYRSKGFRNIMLGYRTGYQSELSDSIVIGKDSGAIKSKNGKKIIIGDYSVILENTFNTPIHRMQNFICIGNRSAHYIGQGVDNTILLGDETGCDFRGKDAIGIGNRALNYSLNEKAVQLGGLDVSKIADSLVFEKKIRILNSALERINTAIPSNPKLNIPNHGLGNAGDFFYGLFQYYSSSYRYNKFIGYFKITVIDNNVLSCSKLNGAVDFSDFPYSGYLCIPKKLTNVTSIGYNSVSTKSNQVTLGDEKIEEVLTHGVYKSNADKSKITEPKHVPTLEVMHDRAGIKLADANGIVKHTISELEKNKLKFGEGIEINEATGVIQVSETYIQSKIDAIEIRGRNLYSILRVKNNNENSLFVIEVFNVEKNQAYTISTNIPRPSDNLCDCWADAGSVINPSSQVNGVASDFSRTIDSGAEGVVCVVFRRTHRNAVINGDFYIKLEKGTRATAWTPAPEDLQPNLTTLPEATDHADAGTKGVAVGGFYINSTTGVLTKKLS